MIDKIIKIWEERKSIIRNIIKSELVHNNNINSYLDILTIVIKQLQDGGLSINPKKITEIDDGDYQGTLLYLIPEDCYQPSEYYYLKMNYGSCSMCDTMQRILCENVNYGSCSMCDTMQHILCENVNDEDTQVKQLMMLALNIVQELKLLEGDAI